MSLSKYLSARSALVDKALGGFLPKATVKPATIHKAMRYSLFAGGKRLRPILTPRRRGSLWWSGSAGAARRVRRRVHPHLFAHPRRPAVHGR